MVAGGPGGSGVEFLMGAGPLLHQLVGDDWDLVGFDPRGIGRTRFVHPRTFTYEFSDLTLGR
jgi:pimeloyl-ACP methyl ester carboxylesterase